MDTRFHSAQAALADGDVRSLATLLTADPALATSRSATSHPTLLQCLVLTMPPVDSLERLIELLADHGAELTDPLIAASGMDNLRAMTNLLDRGARIEGNRRWSPLEEAIYWGHEAAVSLLLQRGAAVTNLRIAAALGDRDALAHCFDEIGALTAAAGEVAWPFAMPISVTQRRRRKQILGNALVHAAAWGRIDSVDFLLDQGARLNLIPAGFDYAGTPLHYAAHRGRRVMVDHLLRAGAYPALRDTKVASLPEDWAEHGGHPELAEHLRVARQGRNGR